MRALIFMFCSAFLGGIPAHSADLVSPFAGSEALGEYAVDFAKYHYLPSDAEDVEPAAVEGRLHSRLFMKPDAKSNYEVIKSFERELKAGGFDVVTLLDDTRRGELAVRGLNAAGQNDILKRKYTRPDGGRTGVGSVAKVGTQAQEYLVARKRIDQTDVLVAVYTSRSGGYAIEQVESAAMEEGTVSLDLDALREQMDNEGRVAIYGIRFDTGSAVIQPGSADTLEMILTYLAEHPQRAFYVVGHTDDQGDFDANMRLSNARSQAVVDAIVSREPAAADRLQAGGVGPLSPISTNTGTDGRQLNRRVELVSRLQPR